MKTHASKTLKVTLGAGTALTRRNVALAVCVALCTVGPAFPQGDHEGTIITFDAPDAGTGAGQGTFALAINPAGAITGSYTDADDVSHGFLRARDGAMTTFDSPGACSSGSACAFLGTSPSSINPAGTITGSYADASNVSHGFLRAREGSFTTFDAPGAGTVSGQGTSPYDINPAGAIAGVVVDENNVSHGFVRAPDGTITTFDAPDAGTSSGQGTFINTRDCLNPAGRLQETTLTQTMCITATCGIRTAPLPSSTLPARAQAPARAHTT